MNRRESKIARLPQSRWFTLATTLLFVWIAGGAACSRSRRVSDFTPPPIVFDAVPTIDELVPVINRTDGIQKLYSNSAIVKAPTMSDKGLNSTLMLQRDKHFRMRGKLSPLPTTLFDLGSNDEVFWLQIPEGMRQTLYFARHADYAQQSQRMILPVDPTWLISAIGLVHLDPTTVIEGPTRRPDGQLEVRSQLAMPDGLYRRVLVVNDTTGVVTEQYLYGPNQQLVARAVASKHRYYETEGCSLPHQVHIHLQPAVGPPLALEMEIGEYTINQFLNDDPQRFVMPQNSAEQIDLVRLGGSVAPPSMPPLQSPNSSPGGAPGIYVPSEFPEGPSTPLDFYSNQGANLGSGVVPESGYSRAQDYRPELRGTTVR